MKNKFLTRIPDGGAIYRVAKSVGIDDPGFKYWGIYREGDKFQEIQFNNSSDWAFWPWVEEDKLMEVWGSDLKKIVSKAKIIEDAN